MIEDYYACLEHVAPGAEPKVKAKTDSSKSLDHYVYSTALRSQMAERFGLGYVLSAGKEIPLQVRQGGASAQLNFLKA